MLISSRICRKELSWRIVLFDNNLRRQVMKSYVIAEWNRLAPSPEKAFKLEMLLALIGTSLVFILACATVKFLGTLQEQRRRNSRKRIIDANLEVFRRDLKPKAFYAVLAWSPITKWWRGTHYTIEYRVGGKMQIKVIEIHSEDDCHVPAQVKFIGVPEETEDTGYAFIFYDVLLQPIEGKDFYKVRQILNGEGPASAEPTT